VIVALDGPAGAGKSTVARRVASRLGFAYLDTGALYRAAAVQARRLNLRFEDTPEMRRMMSEIRIGFDGGRISLNGEDLSDQIRTPEISHYASVISALPVVREMLLPLQQRVGRTQDVVAEGRDMGTTVFPEAEHKYFLDASSQERARRRFLELQNKGVQTTMQEVFEEMKTRDERDSSRAAAPLRQAPDAVYILTDGKTVDEIVEAIVGAVRNYTVRISGPT